MGRPAGGALCLLRKAAARDVGTPSPTKRGPHPSRRPPPQAAGAAHGAALPMQHSATSGGGPPRYKHNNDPKPIGLGSHDHTIKTRSVFRNVPLKRNTSCLRKQTLHFRRRRMLHVCAANTSLRGGAPRFAALTPAAWYNRSWRTSCACNNCGSGRSPRYRLPALKSRGR